MATPNGNALGWEQWRLAVGVPLQVWWQIRADGDGDVHSHTHDSHWGRNRAIPRRSAVDVSSSRGLGCRIPVVVR